LVPLFLDPFTAKFLGALLTPLCNPKMVPPPIAYVECNSKEGSKGGYRPKDFTDIRTDHFSPFLAKWFLVVGTVATQLIHNDVKTEPNQKEQILGKVAVVNPIFIFALDLLEEFLGGAAGKAIGKKAKGATGPVTKNLAKVLGPVAGGLVTALLADFLNYEVYVGLVEPGTGQASHIVVPILLSGVTNNFENKFYPLGRSKITWEAKYILHIDGSPLGVDRATQDLIVMDNQSPAIVIPEGGKDSEGNFTSPVVVEANVHWGYDRTFDSDRMGKIIAIDDCVPDNKVTLRPEQTAPTYFPLEKLRTDTGADIEDTMVWEAYDQKYDFLDREVGGSSVLELVIAAFLGNSKAEIDKILNKKGTEDLVFQTPDGVVFTREKIVSGKFRSGFMAVKGFELDQFNNEEKQVTRHLKFCADKANKKSPICSPSTLESTKAKKIEITKKKAKGQAFGRAFAGGIVLFNEVLFPPSEPALKSVGPNVNIQEQKLMVVDTLLPDVLPPKTIALEIPITQNTVILEIDPPQVFDIADPRPTIKHNLTDVPDNDTFEILADNTVTFEFPTGITKIVWLVEDYSGNKRNTTQLVNIKHVGENEPSVAHDISIFDVLSNIPKEITLTADNPDRDPLQFLLTANPFSGFILSPLDAIFQDRFQEEGKISILSGIAKDDTDATFFGDTVQQRVMKMTSDDELSEEFAIMSPEPVFPTGIARSDSGGFYYCRLEAKK